MYIIRHRMMKALVRGRYKLLCDGNENTAGIALVDFLSAALNWVAITLCSSCKHSPKPWSCYSVIA